MSFILIQLYIICVIIRPQDWVPVFLDKPLVNWLAIATAVVILFERMSSKDAFLMKVPHNMFMCGFFLSILMSHVAHGYLGGVSESFTLVLPTFLLFFIVLNSLDKEWKLWGILGMIVFLVSLLVLQGIDQLKTGIGWAGQNIYFDVTDQSSRINWIGIFNDPNDLALLFVVAIGVLLPLIFSKINFLFRFLSVFLVGWISYGVYLTNSRGGYLALMAALFFFFVRRTNKFVLGTVLGSIVVAGALAVGPSRLGLISADEDSAYSRLDLWYEGLQMLKSNPLFGVGHNMFTEDLPMTAHNSYVLAAAELGFFGLFCWVGLIYISYTGISKIYRNVESMKLLALGVQSSLIGFCAAAFFLSRTYVIMPYLLFAFSGALIFMAKEKDSSLDFQLKGKDYRNITLSCVGILLAVFTLYKIGLR